VEGLDYAIPSSDQPIGGEHGSATLFGEPKWLVEWVTPRDLSVQEKYEQLTSGLSSLDDKIMACLRYVCEFPYTRFVRVETRVGGKTFVQNDAWLPPSQAMEAPKINCANRAFILASLLRQELPADDVWVVMGNINVDGQDGHAWDMIKQYGQQYILDPTNRSINARPVPISWASSYEDVLYFNDFEVKAIPERRVREPFTACYYCIPFLNDYVDRELCYNL
jgi:hypothetical protein